MSEHFKPPAPNLEERVARLEQLAVAQQGLITSMFEAMQAQQRSTGAMIEAMQAIAKVVT